MTSSPSLGLDTMANILPIDLYLQKTALASYVRMKENGTWKTRETDVFSKYRHSTVIKTLSAEVKDLMLPRDKLRYKETIDTKFETVIKNRDEWKDIVIRPTPHEEG